MKNLKTITSIAALVFFLFYAVFATASTPTNKPDKSFKVSSKSKTIEMAKGQTYNVKMNLKADRFYFMSIDGKKSLGNIQYRIIDPNQNNKVIFDNSAYEFDKNMTFHNDVERDVVIVITTMPCCLSNSSAKKSDVNLVFANKKVTKKEDINIHENVNLYAVK